MKDLRAYCIQGDTAGILQFQVFSSWSKTRWYWGEKLLAQAHQPSDCFWLFFIRAVLYGIECLCVQIYIYSLYICICVCVCVCVCVCIITLFLVKHSILLASFKIFCWWKWKSLSHIPTLCDPMDYTVHGILQVRILEWVAFPFSKGIFLTQGSNPGLLHCRRIFLPAQSQGKPLLCW